MKVLYEKEFFMNDVSEKMPARLAEIIEDFSFCQGREKLEYLLEFAEKMPPLPEGLDQVKDKNHQVHECITPIYVYATENEGNLRFYFDVPKESPTVRGYASLMHEGVYDVPPQTILDIPEEFYRGMGLHTVISGQRLNGLSGILRHMKRLATNSINTSSHKQ